MFELSYLAFDILWADLDLGAHPFPLDIPSHGDTMTERARLREVVYDQLATSGLVHARRPIAELEAALRLTADPMIDVDAVANPELPGERLLRALGVAHGGQAALVVQHDNAVEFRDVRDTALIAELVALLPPGSPGHGPVLELPATAFARREATAEGYGSVLTRPGDTTTRLREQVDALRAIQERPTLGAGQFGVSAKDELGHRQRLGGLSWFSTDRGQYSVTVAPGPDGVDLVTVTPAGADHLTRQLAQLLAGA